MKMAKASEADLNMAMNLLSALDLLGQRWVPCMPEAIEKLQEDSESERFDRHDDEQCGRALRYLLELADRASLGRVVWGCVVMLDPRNKLVDPNADTIERYPRFDMEVYLARQAEFSARTFGPGPRVEGVTDHITKELVEVRESGGALAEWVDVIILALDGAWRSGATPAEIIAAIVAKQTKNEGRTWPDWRTVPSGKAIEHDRSKDAA